MNDKIKPGEVGDDLSVLATKLVEVVESPTQKIKVGSKAKATPVPATPIAPAATSEVPPRAIFWVVTPFEAL